MLTLSLNVIIAHYIEVLFGSRGKRPLARMLHAANVTWVLAWPIYQIYTIDPSPHPAAGLMLMFAETIIGLKLVSFVVQNEFLESAAAQSKKTDKASESQSPVGHKEEKEQQHHDDHQLGTTPVLVFGEEVIPASPVAYPQNLTLKHTLYFLASPTLVYETSYPRTARVRVRRVLYLLCQCIGLLALEFAFIQQYIQPLAMNAIQPIRAGNIPSMVERLLKLAIPNIGVWLGGFYLIFHVILNLIAEVTRFGDRLFYMAWWNSPNLEVFWRTWNMPVHHWVKYSIYFPLTKSGYSRTSVAFFSFFVSAVLHEVVISVPFRNVKLWAFFGMLAQAPLIFLSKALFPKSSDLGNSFVWGSLLLGQPLLVLAYYFQYSTE
jgi:diacylglycerol O-acyltransferase-1